MKPVSVLYVLILFSVSCWRISAQIYDTNGDFVQTFAGSGESGLVDGQGALTKFANPSQIVADSSGNLYVWDSGNSVIRKITTNATVSTLAGGGFDFSGWGTNVSFSSYIVGSMSIDHSDTIWLVVTYSGQRYLLNIDTNSFVTIENGGPGLTNLSTSSSICFDSANNLYYSGGNIVYRYSPVSGISQPFAGNGTSGYVDGKGTVFPEFSFGAGGELTCDQADNIYVWDSGNYRIRRIDQSQNITTIAGTGTSSPFTGIDATGTNASFYPGIYAMVSDNSGNIYVACGGTSIRKMNVQTNVVTMAGSFTQNAYTNGVAGNLARFSSANGICLAQGMIFVADSGNQRIRNISFNPVIQTVSPANLGIGTYAGITITGVVGRTYQIQLSPNSSTWTTRATVLLTSSPYLWIDQNPITGNSFYRALLLP
jgi:hypothetical protein